MFLVAAVLAPIVPTGSVGAASSPKDARAAELQDAIGEASADEAAALQELGDIRSRRRELDAAVAGFDAQIRGVEAKIAAIQADVDRFTAEAVAREAEAAAARPSSTRRSAASPKRPPPCTAVRTAPRSTPKCWTSTTCRTRSAARSTWPTCPSSGAPKSSRWPGSRSRSRRSSNKRRCNATRRRPSRQKRKASARQLAELRAEQQHQRDAVAKEEASERALVASIQSRKDQFADELASLQATSTVVSQFLAARQRGQKRATSFHVVRPVPGAITGGFGNRVHPILGTVRVHTGVDMSAAEGTPIKAGAAGVVAWAGPRGGYGNAVIIDHGNQFATLYGHASAVKVSVGQTVKAGQVVALAGSTGMATGPHLHFEVRILGVPVNPASYL